MSPAAERTLRSIAFVGSGLMGAPMIRRLLGAGYEVRVWNRTRAKVEPLIALGARGAASAAEAASGADLMCTCVTDGAALERVLFDEAGLAYARSAPPCLVDFSTIGPYATLALARRLEGACASAWVDAPVSGGATGAEQGRLIIFCGGPKALVERLEPVFASIAQRVNHVGALGTGQTMKLVNQLIVATNMVAIAEALLLARASGLTLPGIPQTLAGGFADSLPLQIFGRRMAEGVRTPILGELGLMLKDLQGAEALAREQGAMLPLTRAALEIYRRAEAVGLMHEDIAALFSFYERQGASAGPGAPGGAGGSGA